MDEKDLLLLQLLEENSRLTTREMAVMAEIAPEEIEARIAALENAGVIRSYSAVIDWERAGNGEVSAIIELKVNPERDFGYDRIAERIARFRQVRALRLITGAYDPAADRDRKNSRRWPVLSQNISRPWTVYGRRHPYIMKSYKENVAPSVRRKGAKGSPIPCEGPMRDFISKKAGDTSVGDRKFFDLALTMEEVISLGVGEPDFSTPWNICEPASTR
jgi:DNA-binding Lrp family transcriptional regulator